MARPALIVGPNRDARLACRVWLPGALRRATRPCDAVGPGCVTSDAPGGGSGVRRGGRRGGGRPRCCRWSPRLD